MATAMRSVGSATISFGMVAIPIKAYVAASAETFSFNLLTKDKNRINQKTVDSVTGKEVERSSLCKGYEISKDNYVIITDEELKAASSEKENLIDVIEFVPKNNLIPIQVEKAYYLAPDKSDRAYRLFVRVLRETKRMAVCKWYCRGRDHLVALTVEENKEVMVMYLLYYANEIREFSANFSKNSEPTETQVELAKQLIQQLSKDHISYSEYQDEYADRIQQIIDKKQAGEEIGTVTVKQLPATPFDDLVATLERSIAQFDATKKQSSSK